MSYTETHTTYRKPIGKHEQLDKDYVGSISGPALDSNQHSYIPIEYTLAVDNQKLYH